MPCSHDPWFVRPTWIGLWLGLASPMICPTHSILFHRLSLIRRQHILLPLAHTHHHRVKLHSIDNSQVPHWYIWSHSFACKILAFFHTHPPPFSWRLCPRQRVRPCCWSCLWSQKISPLPLTKLPAWLHSLFISQRNCFPCEHIFSLFNIASTLHSEWLPIHFGWGCNTCWRDGLKLSLKYGLSNETWKD